MSVYTAGGPKTGYVQKSFCSIIYSDPTPGTGPMILVDEVKAQYVCLQRPVEVASDLVSVEDQR